MKYIIDIEPIKGTSLHKATKFNTLVFDEEGLRRLKKVKEKPIVRNVDHVAEGLEKLGYNVGKEYLIKSCCPPNNSVLFGNGSCSYASCCEECRKWWLEEYKGVENE